MMMHEFIERTGFEPMPQEYAKIEEAYYNFDGDKDAFCKAYVQRDGEKQIYQARATEIDRLNSRILELYREAKRDGEKYEERIIAIQAQLDRELEWKPYEDSHNITQAQYTSLAESVPGAARYMTDEEALNWVCNEFGFDRSKVTILHEIDEYEINRHNRLRRTGKKIDRRPIYCATDYHYIRFSAGHGEWQWEAWNGKMRPFYD